MMIRRLSLVSALAIAALATGCASTAPTMDANRPISKSLQASVVKGVAKPTVVANGHEIDPEVTQSLLDSFSKQATKAGVKVLDTGLPVTITVQEYSARPTAARLLVGVLAGKDHIKADVALGDSKFVIEDTARTVVNGINSVAENVGVQAANGVATIGGLQSN
ncbi:hypothetical protein RA280_26920 [Cupriavidus sp. CV2]|uniref:hypothetical protein n=1 Tax=Cupriavidus ulmosensis TaxID=3065913 RepID=UPI00296AAC18|nr:hypothetical protein [Cupriavidus sp. CV2]MDW3685313.1 hypothetical protein [Cupriavidus sp. CV2]